MKLSQLAAAVGGLLCLALCSKTLLAQAPSPSAPPAAAQPEKLLLPDNTTELDVLLSQKKYTELGLIFRGTNKFDDIVRNMNWQRGKVLSGASAFVSFAYMNDLDRISTALGDVRGAETRKTAAMILLYTYELILIDGPKCKDTSAPAHRRDQLLTVFPNVVKSIHTLSDADVDTIIRVAIKAENSTASRRADDDFLCRDGLAEMQAALAKFGKDAAREVPTPPGGIGKTMEMKKDPDYKPELLAKDIWEPKQAELRTLMPEILTKLVAALRKDGSNEVRH